jgi:hypothetical protein
LGGRGVKRSDNSGRAASDRTGSSATGVWQDPVAARVTFDEWGELFENVPTELLDRYHYFRRDQEEQGGLKPWSAYMFPPQTFAVYGNRHLMRLKYDNSLAALRLWGFVQNETERLFRARQVGRKVVATMGDLGAVPVLVNSFPELVAFYPDCIWWTPFAMESNVLFDAAAELGIGDATCFSRAALGAFAKHAYFPDPDLVIASTGASCDDYSGVEQLAGRFSSGMLWVETPMRREKLGCHACAPELAQTHDTGMPYDPESLDLLVHEYRRVLDRLEALAGRSVSEEELRAGVRKANRVRRLTRRLRELAFRDAVLPALELMVVEFGCLHHYADIDEWPEVLEHLVETCEARAERGEKVVDPDALRIVWVSPPADPLFLNYVEDHGARVVGTEYVIGQALELLDENKPPVEAVAESFMASSLTGSTRQRVESVLRLAREHCAEGVMISGILGGSHCAMETRLIARYVRENLDIPVLEFDVPAPAKEINRQLRTRIDAFLEVLRERR